jgi:predicted O-methyltransferase YrrM
MLGTYAQRTAWYVQYALQAKTRHGVHSPFVYALADRVLPHRDSLAGDVIEKLRYDWGHNTESITIEDLGAGYDADGLRTRTVALAQVVRGSARGRRTGELLYRLVQHLQPKRCLELGTNLGFSMLYHVAALHGDASFTTVEGSVALAAKARQLLAEAQPDLNIGCAVQIVQAPFDNVLRDLTTNSLDYVFLDGHHTEAATLAYADAIVPALADGGLLVLDDIYWSAGMRRAWRTLCARPEVSASIDLYHLGLCFVRRPQRKEHFVLWW